MNEVGVILALKEFIECMDSAMDRIDKYWDPKLEEFRLASPETLATDGGRKPDTPDPGLCA